MLCHKERKVCIIRLFCRILITVAIYRYDSISILYSDSYIYSVRFCRHIKILAHCLHPFTSASANGYDTFVTSKCTILAAYTICSIVQLFHSLYRCVKIKLYLVLKICIQIL